MRRTASACRVVAGDPHGKRLRGSRHDMSPGVHMPQAVSTRAVHGDSGQGRVERRRSVPPATMHEAALLRLTRDDWKIESRLLRVRDGIFAANPQAAIGALIRS